MQDKVIIYLTKIKTSRIIIEVFQQEEVLYVCGLESFLVININNEQGLLVNYFPC